MLLQKRWQTGINTMKKYGKELILDLHRCDADKFNRKDIENYFIKLCKLIKMQREKLCWWDDLGWPLKERETLPHLKGTSAVQFIKTSNVTIHTLDLLKSAYINIFSCKNFNEQVAKEFSEKWFKGKAVNFKVINRI